MRRASCLRRNSFLSKGAPSDPFQFPDHNWLRVTSTYIRLATTNFRLGEFLHHPFSRMSDHRTPGFLSVSHTYRILLFRRLSSYQSVSKTSVRSSIFLSTIYRQVHDNDSDHFRFICDFSASDTFVYTTRSLSRAEKDQSLAEQ